MNWRSSWTCIDTSSSVRSARPDARRRAFCASSIWSTSSSSSSASTSGERVGFQSSTSAPESGWYLPIAAKIRNRISRKARKKAPSTAPHSRYGERVREEALTEADVDLLKRGYELYNAQDFDGLEAMVSPDIVFERDGGAPPIRGYAAFRAFNEPDAFEWQRIEPLEFVVAGDKVFVPIRIRAKGAISGVELDMEAWQVWTFADGLPVRLAHTFDEERGRELFAG